MYYLSCIFDRKKRPLYAASFNDETKEAAFYQLYLPGTKFPLYEVKENEKKIVKIFYEDDVVVTGFKSYVKAFDLNLTRRYEVFDACIESESCLAGTIPAIKKHLLKQISSLMEVEQQEWQQVLADSQLVYRHFEKSGHYQNGKKVYPEYDLAFTGRSKCHNHNIQGANANDSIYHIDDDNEVFVHFDWIAADFRVASLISKDKYLQDSFKTSDPYTALFKALDIEDLTREQCKLELFRSLYSMNAEADSLEFYPDFAEWMKKSAEKIELEGFSTSLLGRRFYLNKDRPIRSVFNAQIQGSVAHAMQNVLYRVFKMFPENVLTEVHDSLILCCKQEDLKTIIPEVSNIMLYPFDGILESNPRFPLKISIGMEWKQWKLYKECR